MERQTRLRVATGVVLWLCSGDPRPRKPGMGTNRPEATRRRRDGSSGDPQGRHLKKALKPAHQRRLAREATQSRAPPCGLFGLARSGLAPPQAAGSGGLAAAPAEAIGRDAPPPRLPSFGGPAAREGRRVNHKKVHRICQEEELSPRTRRRKSRVCRLRRPRRRRSDPTTTGRPISCPTNCGTAPVSGSSTPSICAAARPSPRKPRRAFPALGVTGILDRLIAQHGNPRIRTIDNGTEFTSRHFEAWACRHKIQLDFIPPGGRWKTGAPTPAFTYSRDAGGFWRISRHPMTPLSGEAKPIRFFRPFSLQLV